MKTAISLPDDLFASADAYAERSQLSRSELYARALREYLERHDQDRVTAQLNAVCAEMDSRLPPEFARASRRVLEREEW
jgi:metal-responsive CopG/Arc/MetJ family transcriptional regulator